MALTDEQKRERAETRKAKEIEAIKAAAAPGSRPGMTHYREQIRGSNEGLSRKFDIQLSPIEQLSPATLEANPRNPYPPLEPEELEELSEDIGKKGVMIPLIARPDGVLVCGHNRLKAAIQAGLETVPVQTLSRPFPVPPTLELEIMKSENDRRRGGHWSPEKKKEFIKKHFADELMKDRRGGDRGNQYTGGKQESGKIPIGDFAKSAPGTIKVPIGDFDPGKKLSAKVEEASKGKIKQKTAERILAKLRKETKRTKQESTKSTEIKAPSNDSAKLAKNNWKTLKRLVDVLENQDRASIVRDILDTAKKWEKQIKAGE